VKRRGNGLDADSYAPLIDLAPHIADLMLDALREAGVAAYVTPTPGPENPPPRATGTDGESLDRLYVDTAMQSAAEGILHRQLSHYSDTGPVHATDGDLLERADDPGDRGEPAKPGAEPPAAERDEDAIWAEIVAGFDAAPADGESPWPDEENLDEPERPDDDENADRTGRLRLARVIKSADEPLPPDDDGHFVPPPPPPLPSTDKVTKAAWIALIGGPVYLLLTVLLGWEVPGWAAFLAVAAFIGGFVTLVLRMGDDPRDNDDGAIV
jgi:hypothetical protein